MKKPIFCREGWEIHYDKSVHLRRRFLDFLTSEVWLVDDFMIFGRFTTSNYQNNNYPSNKYYVRVLQEYYKQLRCKF